MIERAELYINGQWIVPTGFQYFDIVNPASEVLLGRVPAATTSDADKAVGATTAAFETWGCTSASERAEYLIRIHAGLLARADEIARTIDGGYKQSGYGRELGTHGLEEFLELKSLQFKA